MRNDDRVRGVWCGARPSGVAIAGWRSMLGEIVCFALGVADGGRGRDGSGVMESDGAFGGYVDSDAGQVTFEGFADADGAADEVAVRVGRVRRRMRILEGVAGGGFVGEAVVAAGGGTAVGVVVAAGIGGAVAVAGGALGTVCCCWCLCGL